MGSRQPPMQVSGPTTMSKPISMAASSSRGLITLPTPMSIGSLGLVRKVSSRRFRSSLIASFTIPSGMRKVTSAM